MKKLSIILLILLFVNMLHAQETEMTRKEKKAAREAEQLEKTQALVDSGTWQFKATQLLPSSGRSRTLTTEYRVMVKKDEIDSHLPYFGRAYSVEYGSSDSPMSFSGEITDLSVEERKKGGWVLSFNTKNKNDIMGFTFHISETGSATLTVNSTNRQTISYNGDLAEIESKK